MSGFSRQKLYDLFSKYKSLLALKGEQKQNKNRDPKQILEEGIDINDLQMGFQSLQACPQELILVLYKSVLSTTEGNQQINFEKFLNIIFDSDSSGSLSFDEVKKQSEVMLGQYFKQNDIFSLSEISEMLTRMIFQSTNTPFDQELETIRLKEEIEKENKSLNLLLQICFHELKELGDDIKEQELDNDDNYYKCENQNILQGFPQNIDENKQNNTQIIYRKIPQKQNLFMHFIVQK
ncbi:hypothetical protein PPERSA_01649 [Pseudocohnilembus persalinus]|uniref:EF-hand domain-containing protein n=1 Tax=Pseudocohnilembus persalinus TaxID=266149 RepID=A0A0V0R1Q5_PSEPJ|nr:hypothetical protein PPERSA_01649 [Pseudocohnilembus persalinus]|eukprot:KRX08104.1 hypothetical protein PPERSA_01649 [Pseudocohnilembus persalinus]